MPDEVMLFIILGRSLAFTVLAWRLIHFRFLRSCLIGIGSSILFTIFDWLLLSLIFLFFKEELI